MILRAQITAWREVARWATDAQVEQDLILSRALVTIFSEPTLKTHLAFRGGTALHKLFLNPPSRYSEHIDLVQVNQSTHFREARFIPVHRTTIPTRPTARFTKRSSNCCPAILGRGRRSENTASPKRLPKCTEQSALAMPIV